jgi:hypothetical protein
MIEDALPICPTPATCAKYGLTQEEWVALFERQGRVCAVCRRASGTGRYNIDHEHVRGWRAMPAAYRKWFVRGIVCHFCNHYYLARGLTVQKARNLVEYLERYEHQKGLR